MQKFNFIVTHFWPKKLAKVQVINYSLGTDVDESDLTLLNQFTE